MSHVANKFVKTAQRATQSLPSNDLVKGRVMLPSQGAQQSKPASYLKPHVRGQEHLFRASLAVYMRYFFYKSSFLLVLATALCVNSAVAEVPSDAWFEQLAQDARASGISETTIEATGRHIELLPNVIALDRSQPEFISPFLDYYHKRVDVLKIKKGRNLLNQHVVLLDKIEKQYGIPRTLLIAFWGMETQYGHYKGDIDTLSALATLAYDGRRAEFFRSQLLDAMKMVDLGHATIGELRGSWAGAFGNMQFMPTTFMFYAVDGDADGTVDLMNSLPDAFASAANYLAKVGWRIDEPAMVEVMLPDNFAWQDAQLMLKKPVDEWKRLGVLAIKTENAGSELVANVAPAILAKSNVRKSKRTKKIKSDHATQKAVSRLVLEKTNDQVSTAELPKVRGQAAILLPQGWRGPAFMVFDNFDVIMDWNRSVNYALSVAQLAKRLDQESRIIGGKLAEQGALSFQQLLELQQALNAKGFDAGDPDGLPGLKTQSAVRAYQVLEKLPADGYASRSLYERLLEQPRYAD